MPMHEMPLIFRFGVLGLGRAFFALGFWVLAFCHWDFVARSVHPANLYTIKTAGLTSAQNVNKFPNTCATGT